ncbi:hypothetical protein YC2023_005794 [Brassica napus]
MANKSIESQSELKKRTKDRTIRKITETATVRKKNVRFRNSFRVFFFENSEFRLLEKSKDEVCTTTDNYDIQLNSQLGDREKAFVTKEQDCNC